MRHLIIFTLGLCLCIKLSADCRSAINIYPKDGQINENNLLIIRGYGHATKVIDSLNIRHPIYLESGSDKIKLVVVEQAQGMYRVSQAFLRPEHNLQLGRTYTVVIENLHDHYAQFLMRWNPETRKHEQIKFTVNHRADSDNPRWKTAPTLGRRYYEVLGCGPNVWTTFHLETFDESETLVKTQLVNLGTLDSNVYYLNIDKGNTLKVGKGMCSGAFYYKANTKYKVRFSLMDVSGNTDKKWTDWTYFESPCPEKFPERSTGRVYMDL